MAAWQLKPPVELNLNLVVEEPLVHAAAHGKDAGDAQAGHVEHEHLEPKSSIHDVKPVRWVGHGRADAFFGSRYEVGVLHAGRVMHFANQGQSAPASEWIAINPIT